MNIEPETIVALAEIDTVRAVKQANPDLGRGASHRSTGLDLYAGDDNLLQPFLELGAVGRHLRPHARRRAAGRRAGARRRTRATSSARARSTASSRPAYELLKVATNPIPIKAALNLLGHEVGGYRLPLVPPTEDELERSRRLPRAPRPARRRLSSSPGAPH